MEKEFIPYDLSLKLKELGFDEPCLKWSMWIDKGDYQCESYLYDLPIDEKGGVSKPLFSQAFRWFRKKHYLSSTVIEQMFNSVAKSSFIINELKTEPKYFKTKTSKIYLSYEEAELACLEKLIEIVERKKLDEGWDELTDVGLGEPFGGW